MPLLKQKNKIMNSRKLSGILIFTGGLFELAVGILHFTWPFSFLQLPNFQGIESSIRVLLLLSALAVGLCLSVFAILSFYFSKQVKTEIKTPRIFCISQSILWIIRLIFEILLPVRVSIYFIDNPSHLIIGGAIVIILVYLLPVVLLKKLVENK
jgi:hypothetical protein